MFQTGGQFGHGHTYFPVPAMLREMESALAVPQLLITNLLLEGMLLSGLLVAHLA